jgi:hypothetical protein
MTWQEQLKGDPIPWLLSEPTPGIKYPVLRDLLDRPADDPELKTARREAHANGPIATVLSKMSKDGYWVKSGPGYTPKYRSTVWSLLLLAQLCASVQEDERISLACGYLLDHSLSDAGQFSYNGTPSGTIDCLQGNLLWALLLLGYNDKRLEKALEWMARSATGEGVAPQDDRDSTYRYYAYKCGPDFACGANGKMPCAWGALKVMMAFSSLPKEKRTPVIERAIRRGIDFFFSVDPATVAYPTRTETPPNRSWWKLSFPVFYVCDILQIVEALAALGYGQDPRLASAVKIVREKQDEQGRWSLEYDYKEKTWVDFGPKRQPNAWVTLRALRTLKTIG